MSLSERANLTDVVQKSRSKNAPKRRANVLAAEQISGIDVEYRIWDMPRFHRIFGSGDGREEIEIDFLQYIDGGVPCLPANDLGETAECLKATSARFWEDEA